MDKQIIDHILKTTTKTKGGYEVKNLRWNHLENIILGQVKDPIFGKPELHDGFVTTKWRKNGTNLKEKGRTEIYLDINF